MNKITFITSNPAKAKQLSLHLKTEVAHHSLDLSEIQSLDLETIVQDKARRAYQVLNSPVLVEDTSLVFSAFGKLPGPLIKWFLVELGNEGLCQLLNGKNRAAKAEVLFGLYDGKHCHTFAGSMLGTIAEEPRGTQGFGWDPIFIPEGQHKTWAEMSLAEQVESSMRKIALYKLQIFLNQAEPIIDRPEQFSS